MFVSGFFIVALTSLSVLILISITTYSESGGHSQTQTDLNAKQKYRRDVRSSEKEDNIYRQQETQPFEPLVKEQMDVLEDMMNNGEYSAS